MLMMKVWKGRSEKTRADHVDGVTQRRTKAAADRNQNVTCHLSHLYPQD
jgi:hypothetical protein